MATALSGCQGGSFAGAGAPATSAALQRAAIARSAPLSITHRLGSFEASLPHVAPPLWMKFAPVIGNDYAYVSQFKGTTLNEYHASNAKNGPPICTIANQQAVNGIGVDGSGNLWVPSGGDNSGVTTVFAPHCGKALLQITDSTGQPAAVAFDSKGNAYIENIISSTGPGYIQVYAPGKTAPKTVLTDNVAFLWFDEALDASDNVFIVYNDPYNKGHVVEFPHGKNSPRALPMTLGFPGGITFDSAGRLLVVDQDARNVSVYVAPFTGKPVGTFALQADSVPCRFAQGKTLLYCADYTNSSIDVYHYDPKDPNGSTYDYSFTNGIGRGLDNDGIALDPAPKN